MNKEKEMAELKLVFLISITHVIFAEIEIWQSCSDVQLLLLKLQLLQLLLFDGGHRGGQRFSRNRRSALGRRRRQTPLRDRRSANSDCH